MTVRFKHQEFGLEKREYGFFAAEAGLESVCRTEGTEMGNVWCMDMLLAGIADTSSRMGTCKKNT